MSDEFNRRLKQGQLGEGYIAQWLIHVRGFHVLPVYEKELETGKGPTLFTAERTIIAPDILAMKKRDRVTETRVKGRVYWIEAKTKSAFTWHYKTQRWTTGIDQRHYNDYLEVNKISLWPVWLLFLQLDGIAKNTPSGKVPPCGLFGGTLKYLSQNVNHTSPNWGTSGMVYWAHNKLQRIAPLEEVLNAGKVRNPAA